MPVALALLCAVAGLACVGLRLERHRAAREALLLWGSLCFVGPLMAGCPRAPTEVMVRVGESEPTCASPTAASSPRPTISSAGERHGELAHAPAPDRRPHVAAVSDARR